MDAAVPTEINHVRDQAVVRITWDDDHVSNYSRSYLRGYCPCAMCQGHGGKIHFVEGAESGLQDISAVGNYAVQFTWADGHSTGIYTFDYLRALCPCAQCQAAGAAPAK